MKKLTQRPSLVYCLFIFLSLGSIIIAPQSAQAVKKAETATLNANQIAAVDQLSAYINSIKTMQGEFIQIGPKGRKVEGYFVVKRPGKLLFRYKKPVMIEIIADGRALVVRNRKLDTQDTWPINKTPMRFLLKSQINLRKETRVLDVKTHDELVTVVLEETTPLGTGKIALTYDNKKRDLKQWTITDSQGLDTTVALYNVEFGKSTDPKWFKIDHRRGIRR